MKHQASNYFEDIDWDFFEDFEDFEDIGEIETEVQSGNVENVTLSAQIKNNLAQCEAELSCIKKINKEMINIFKSTDSADRLIERKAISKKIKERFQKLNIINFLKQAEEIGVKISALKKEDYEYLFEMIQSFEDFFLRSSFEKLRKHPKKPYDFLLALDVQEQKQKDSLKIDIKLLFETFDDTQLFLDKLHTMLKFFQVTKFHINEFRKYYHATCIELEKASQSPASEIDAVKKQLVEYSQEYMQHELFLDDIDIIIKNMIGSEKQLHSALTFQFNAKNRNNSKLEASNAPTMDSEKYRIRF